MNHEQRLCWAKGSTAPLLPLADWNPPRSARGRRDGERSRRRICALVTLMAVKGRSAYENRCARISMMARSSPPQRAGYISARPTSPSRIPLRRTAGPYIGSNQASIRDLRKVCLPAAKDTRIPPPQHHYETSRLTKLAEDLRGVSISAPCARTGCLVNHETSTGSLFLTSTGRHRRPAPRGPRGCGLAVTSNPSADDIGKD
jgi:hypothetical protein